MPVIAVELFGVVVGALVAGLPSVLYGATIPPLIVTALALSLAGAGMGMLDARVRWRWGAGVGIGLALLTVARIVMDYRGDETSHNLAPFEVVIALLVGLPPSAVGVFLARVARPYLPLPEALGGMFVTAALVLAFVDARQAQSDLARVEASTQNKVVALLAKQKELQSADPARGFTCDLRLLAPASGSVREIDAGDLYLLNGVEYWGGTSLMEGEYRYSLRCPRQSKPQELFILTAHATPIGWRPLRTFCAAADGAVRAANSGRLHYCFDEGRVVHQVP